MKNLISVTECPRDAMQGIKTLIDTEDKITYLQSLMAVDFDILDCGSFVSPKAVPQMADTADVLQAIEGIETKSKLSVIVGNRRGAELALRHENVDFLGFPFSVSENFQQFNTNAGREEGVRRIDEILKMLQGTGKEMILYISMGFGNPYGEDWSVDLVKEYVSVFADKGIEQIKLSDTVGAAQTPDIEELYATLIPQYPHIEFGAHFHTIYNEWYTKVEAAWNNGCRHFDGAILGKGGCPMSKSDMVGNMPTEKLVSFAAQHNIQHKFSTHNFQLAYNRASELFGSVVH